uniref:Retrovirus-related Pol polyprotein from transposon TNT 1-94 n=1 Tax=Tanacetum cinerariifolium TaxID=118510 RepID=A0A6L2J8L0_TANCI|nr:retrovirus-related Pol polyprotein from transposon TNT 1-94 [Tanacetum cinerariifolium]
MSNTNNNLQNQTSNALPNAIIKAGGKDCPPMLAPGNYVQWKSIIKRYIDIKPNNEFIYYCLQNPPYKFKWTEKTVLITKGSSKTTTEGYIENYKNVSQDIRNQLDVEAKAVQIILTGIDNDIYSIVDACPNACEITSPKHSIAHQNNTSRINRGTMYDSQRVVNVVGARENVETKTGKGCNLSQGEDAIELEAHYMFMVQIQEVTPDAADNFGPIFDTELLQKVQNNDDNYNVFSNDREHLEQPESINDTYMEEQGDTNITTDLLDMSTNGETIDQDDDDDLARECDLLASLIDKLKCEIDDNKNHNKLLESSNKTLVDKLKDLKKFQVELDRYHDVNYASKVEIDYAKAKAMSRIDKNDKSFKENHSKVFLKERKQYFEIQDLKAQLQDKGITISELKKLIEKLKRKFVETKFKKPSDIRQPNAFKSQRQSILGKPDTLSDSLAKTDFSKSNTREPKRTMNKSIAISLKRTVALENTNHKPRSKIKKQYEQISKTCKWWYSKITPSGYKWKPKNTTVNVKPNLVEIILFIIDFGCSKHMTRNLKLLSNFVEKFMGTVKLGNDQNLPNLGYEDMVQGDVTIKRVYYVEGLNHNLFFVGQFCDVDLEVAFRKSTCYIRDLKGNDLLIGSRGSDLYSITLQDTSTPNPICLMAKAALSQAWLWHRRHSHLKFDSINLLSKNDIVIGLPKLKFVKDHLCSSCEVGKAKRKSFHTKTTSSSKRRLQLLHVDLCDPVGVESINGKKYVLVIVDDYYRYTWTHFLKSKDETSKVLIDFLKIVQRVLHAQVRTI